MGVIRAQAAYNVHNKALYDLALGTFVGVIWMLGTEMVVWRTVKMGDVVVPLGITGVGVLWMGWQRGSYIAV